METTGGLICLIVELSTRMQGRQDDTLRGHTLLVHPDRDTTAIIAHGTCAIRGQRHPYISAVSCQMLIDRVIYDLVDQVIETTLSHRTDVHTRSHTDRLQPLEDRNTRRIILLCHKHSCFYSISTPQASNTREGLIYKMIPQIICFTQGPPKGPANKRGARYRRPVKISREE